jgi:hypothetical protein
MTHAVVTHAVVLCDRLIGNMFHLSAELVAVTGTWPDGSLALNLEPHVFARRIFGSGAEDAPDVADLLTEARGTAHALGHVLNGGGAVLLDKVATGDEAAVERWLSEKAAGHAIEAATYIGWVREILTARHADLVRRHADLGSI